MNFWRAFFKLIRKGRVWIWLTAKIINRILFLTATAYFAFTYVNHNHQPAIGIIALLLFFGEIWWVSNFLDAGLMNELWRCRQPSSVQAPYRIGQVMRFDRSAFRKSFKGAFSALRSNTETPNAGNQPSDAEARGFYLGGSEFNSAAYAIPYALSKNEFELNAVIRGLYQLFQKELKGYPYPAPLHHYSYIGPPMAICFFAMIGALFLKAYTVAMVLLLIVALVGAPIFGAYGTLYNRALPLMQAEAMWILLDEGSIESKKAALGTIGMSIDPPIGMYSRNG